MGQDVPIAKKGYLELVHALTDKMQKVQRESNVSARQLSVRRAQIEQLELKVRLLTYDSVAESDVKK